MYDYGQGGVWAYVSARSGAQIEKQFPELKVVSGVPRWMSQTQLAEIKRSMSFDIDRKDGLLAKIIETRARRRRSGAAGTAGTV